MAVRFLPPSDRGADASAAAPDRGDLAEVIELRSRLVRPAPPVSDPAPASPAKASEPLAEPVVLFPGAPPVDEPTSEPTDGELREEPSTVVEDGVRLLARKARSSGELRRELAGLGHDAHEIDRALLDFESSLYLDDLGLARVVAEGLRERKRASRMQIRLKLRERLLPDGVIEAVLAEFDDEGEDELLRVAAEDRARRLGGLDRQTAERRLLGFLARRGWSGERASRVAREALDRADARGAVRFR